jgi:hypothetical protein
MPPAGELVPPVFEGWYANPDGTHTFSFGYVNRNTRDTLEISLGPDNFIEPAQFDGLQPTSFPPGRERGVFTVTVPPDFQGDVVWTLRQEGRVASSPGRATSDAYEFGFEPMPMGSYPPVVRLTEGAGPEGVGPVGIWTPDPLSVRVGVPLSLTLWATDELSTRVDEDDVPLGVSWYKHQGPGSARFSPGQQETEGVGGGQVTTSVTFSEPGQYLIRARVDNFSAEDSFHAGQCCWTNAYFSVVVSP